MSDHNEASGSLGTSSIEDASRALHGLPISIGGVIHGRYRVDRVLGAGGMGVVLAGVHLGLEQRVAIKVMRPEAVANRELVARFSREARATAQLKSDHVARVVDVGTLDGHIPFLVMEFLDGVDFSTLLREQGALGPADAVAYMLQVCSALAEAHRAGIVHRDIKPANLFLTDVGGVPRVKVLDFGISKLGEAASEDDGDDLTQTKAMMGTPNYMSPEQLKSPRGVDARADIWSVGAVLFRLLTNKAPFAAPSAAELSVAILLGEPRTLAELAPTLPRELDRLIQHCLAKAPEDRPQTVEALAGMLRGIQLGLGEESTVVMPSPVAHPLSARAAAPSLPDAPFDHPFGHADAHASYPGTLASSVSSMSAVKPAGGAKRGLKTGLMVGLAALGLVGLALVAVALSSDSSAPGKRETSVAASAQPPAAPPEGSASTPPAPPEPAASDALDPLTNMPALEVILDDVPPSAAAPADSAEQASPPPRKPSAGDGTGRPKPPRPPSDLSEFGGRK